MTNNQKREYGLIEIEEKRVCLLRIKVKPRYRIPEPLEKRRCENCNHCEDRICNLFDRRLQMVTLFVCDFHNFEAIPTIKKKDSLEEL